MCEADNGIANVVALSKQVNLIIHQQAHFLPQNNEIQLIQASSPSSSSVVNSIHHQFNNKQATLSTQANNLIQVRAIKLTDLNNQLRLLCAPSGELPMRVEWLKDGQLVYSTSLPSQQESQTATAAIGEATNFNGRGHVSTRKATHYSQLSQLQSPTTDTAVISSRMQAASVESELIVTNVKSSDAGLYQCSAANSFGSASRQMQLILQELPSAPSAVELAHISSRSIGIRWPIPFDGHAQIIKYVVECRQVDGKYTQILI